MSECPSLGSTSEAGLFYALEPEFLVEDIETVPMTWYEVPITGESLDAALTSAVSEQITSQRSYSNSKLVQGEVSGSINYELQANGFFYDMLACVLQANVSLNASAHTSWPIGGSISNGTTRHCLVFLKRVQVGSGVYDWFIFRGVQVSSLSAQIQPNALVTGTITLLGIKPQSPIEAAPLPALWSVVEQTRRNLMAGADALSGFSIDAGGTPTDVTMQSLDLAIDSQLRQQQAVGIGHAFSAGIGAGRLSVKYSGASYYRNPIVFQQLLADGALTVGGALTDSEGEGFAFSSGFVKINSGGIPTATAPDQDLLINTELQAFEDAVTGSVQITKLSEEAAVLISSDGCLVETTDLCWLAVRAPAEETVLLDLE